MGRFAVRLQIANRGDEVLAERGLLKPELVRRLELDGVVDSGAAYLVLPQSVVKKLGLPLGPKVKVRHADRRQATRDSAEDVRLELQGRKGIFTAVVEPKRRTALIGAVVLEVLDLLVDCTHLKLVPRDPDFVVSEIE
jgi:predicted aspartyl protease